MPNASYSPPPLATATVVGLVSVSAQTFAGIKTFTSIVQLPSIVTASLPAAASYPGGIAFDSTTNEFKYSNGSAWVAPGGGVTTMGAVGSSPNANGATISGSTLTLQPASNPYPGVVSATTQSFVGAKTFVNAVTVNGALEGTASSGEAFKLANTMFTVDQTKLSAAFGATPPTNNGRLLVEGKNLIATNNAISSLNVTSTISSNDSDTRHNYGSRFVTTIAGGASNSNKTLNCLDVDTVNTDLTGVTTKLLNVASGGTSRFAIGEAGDILIGGSAGTATYVLTSGGAGAPPTWSATGGGEVNTASNVGTGNDVFKQKTGVDLEFRTLLAGSGISITQNADDLTIAATGSGEVNTASNVGTGEDVFKQKTGVDLEFRTLLAGSGISITQNADDLTIAATGSGVTTMGAVGSSPNANGATISGTTLTLQPADATNPGVVTTGAQTIAGDKTLSGALTLTAASGNSLVVDTTTLVADATNNRVGIGTASPSYTLDATSAASTWTARIASTDTTGSGGNLVLENAHSGAGHPFLTLRKNAADRGSINGYDATAFGMVDGINISAASSKNIGFRVGSTQVGGFTSGGNFFVDTNALYVDSSNNRIGVNISAPTVTAHIQGGTGAGDGSRSNLMILQGTSYTSGAEAQMQFAIGVSPNGAGLGAAIAAVDVGSFDTKLDFRTRNNTAHSSSTLTTADTRMSIGTDGDVSITPGTVTTAANNFVSGLSVAGSYTKNDTNTRQFYVNRIAPTFNFGGSNTNTTVDILSVDSTNTAVTGTTVNLINARYGGTSQFKVSSGGVVTTVGEVTVGNSLVQSGNNQAMEMKGWASDGAGAIGVKVIAANTLSTAGAVIANFYNAGTIKAGISKEGAYNPDFTDDSATVGDSTVNKPAGQSTIAAAATSITITNSVVKGTSIVLAVLQTNDTTAQIKNVVPGTGTFTINLSAAATANTKVGWTVINGN